MPNRSLDDFAGGGDPESSADIEAEPEGDADATDTGPDALATYRWTPDETPCPACGESVRKRWLDGDEYVCADCKDW